MSAMSSHLSSLWNSSSDVLYWRLQLIASLLVGITFVVGFWSLRVGSRANKRQSREIVALGRGTEELRTANIEAQKALEDEKTKRIAMEEALAPRALSTHRPPPLGDLTAPLKRFDGIQVEIRHAPDFEAKRAAGQIWVAIEQAGWKAVSVIRDEDLGGMGDDGVTIEWYFPEWPTPGMPQASIDENARLERKAQDAAQAFAKFLSGEPNKWKKVSATWPRDRGELPPNTLRIKIGLKPSPFLPKEVKELHDQIKAERAKAREDRAKLSAQRRAEMHERQRKEYEKNPPPAWWLKQQEEREKEWDAREKEWEERDKERDDQL
jgi:hypothetical protein